MSRLDDWVAEQWAGMVEGGGGIARAAWADIGNAYQAMLTQDASIGPPAPVIGDMVTTHDPAPEGPASDYRLEALAGDMKAQELLDAHEIAQDAATDELEHALSAPEPEAGMEPEYG